MVNLANQAMKEAESLVYLLGVRPNSVRDSATATSRSLPGIHSLLRGGSNYYDQYSRYDEESMDDFADDNDESEEEEDKSSHLLRLVRGGETNEHLVMSSALESTELESLSYAALAVTLHEQMKLYVLIALLFSQLNQALLTGKSCPGYLTKFRLSLMPKTVTTCDVHSLCVCLRLTTRQHLLALLKIHHRSIPRI